MSESDKAVHSYMRFSACGACGDLDGCHLWREDERDAAVNPAPKDDDRTPMVGTLIQTRGRDGGPPKFADAPRYRQRFAEHRDIERAKADALIAALPAGPADAVALGALVFEILSGPEKVAGAALSRIGFQNAEMTTVDGKTIIRFRANGKQFIVAVAADS